MRTINDFRKVIEFLIKTQSGVTVRGNDCLNIQTAKLIAEISESIGELRVYKIINDQESYDLVCQIIVKKINEHDDFDTLEFLEWKKSNSETQD